MALKPGSSVKRLGATKHASNKVFSGWPLKVQTFSYVTVFLYRSTTLPLYHIFTKPLYLDRSTVTCREFQDSGSFNASDFDPKSCRCHLRRFYFLRTYLNLISSSQFAFWTEFSVERCRKIKNGKKINELKFWKQTNNSEMKMGRFRQPREKITECNQPNWVGAVAQGLFHGNVPGSNPANSSARKHRMKILVP